MNRLLKLSLVLLLISLILFLFYLHCDRPIEKHNQPMIVPLQTSPCEK